VKGEYNVYPNPQTNNHSKYQNKEEYTHTIKLNIKRDKNMKEKGEEKNIKKNHINYAHPNKWPDSLASIVESPFVATEIVTGRRTKK